MFWIILSIISAIIVAVVAFAPLPWRSANHEPGDYNYYDFSKLRAAVLAGILGLWGLFTILNSVVIVQAGHVAVIREFGQIVGQRSEGLQLVMPWQNAHHESIQVRKTEFFKETDLGHVAAASLETQDVYFDVTLNWQVSPGAVQQLHRNVGTDFFNILIPTRVHQYFKQESVQYTAIEATQKREEIRQRVASRLASDLEQFSITVVSLQIDNISYNPAFSQAIEEKQVATQQALRERERIEQTRAEAEQAIERARGEANAEIERARGEAEAVLINGAATAEANRLISESLTPELIQYAALEHLDGVQIALLPADGSFLIDPTGILGRGLTAE